MDFLDQIINPLLADKDENSVSFYTLEKLETLIRLCSLDKERLWIQFNNLRYESEAMELYNFLLDYQPIPGYHCTPHTLKDQKIAIEYMVAKDDLHEIRFK
jgi:hypothetical protein